MEYINGIAINAINAEADSAISEKSIFAIAPIIISPTIISAGAVANDGIARKIGDKNSDNPNKAAAVTDVRPVLPPNITPDELSTKVVNFQQK